MSVKVDFRVMSDVKCKCGRPLKANLVNKKGPKAVCYKCHTINEAKRGHRIGKLGKPRSVRLEAGLPVKVRSNV